MTNLDGPTQEEVDAHRWWHSITFPNGVKSRGGKSEQLLCAEADAVFRYPVAGKSVLDIGAWNGFFSVEAKRRGAGRVAALDYWTWDMPPNETGFKSFELVRRHLAPDIEDLHYDVMDLKHSGIGQFDCVLFLGVLYHLRHPFYAIELLAECTRELLVLETVIDAEDYSRPAMVFYPGKELGGDESNWWGQPPLRHRYAAGFRLQRRRSAGAPGA
jgi:tRNA (mo5U34)-methyltransferase